MIAFRFDDYQAVNYADGFTHSVLPFLFYNHEANEPAHVDQGDKFAKFWLSPVALVRNFGYNAKELNKLMRLFLQHQTKFVEAWYEHFN